MITEKTRLKMRMAKLGRKLPMETRLKMSKALMGNKHTLGHKLSENHRMKISKALEGKKNSLGYKHTDEWKKNASERYRGHKSYAWKGDNASYCAKHKEIHTHFGKANKCENPNCIYPRRDKNRPNKILHRPKRFEWANVSGEYKRDRIDYIQLCSSCHRLWDNRSIEINGIKK